MKTDYKVRCTEVWFADRDGINIAINRIRQEYGNRPLVHYGACFNYPKGKDQFTVLFVLNKSHNEKKIVVNQFKKI